MRMKLLATFMLVPLILFVSIAPTHAFVGGITGAIQRAQIIANQITQIAVEVSEVAAMADQLNELQDQLTHMKEAALGQVNALTQPFADLASAPATIVSDGINWGSDFTGESQQLVSAVTDMGQNGTSITQLWRNRLAQADVVGEQDILALFTNHPPEAAGRVLENYRATRQQADNRRVLDYTTLDAAAALTQAIQDAQGSFATLRNNTNISNTALQQAQISGLITQGEINTAGAQLLAYQAVREATENQEAEVRRLEDLAAWRAAEERAEAVFQAQQAATEARREQKRQGLLFPTS